MDVKREPVDVKEPVVLAPSQEVTKSCSRVGEVLEPRGPLHDADRVLIQSLGVTDYILLYYTLVTDEVLPHGFLEDFIKLEQSVRRRI